MSGYGATLAEAEADLLRQAEPRDEAALPPDILAALQESR